VPNTPSSKGRIEKAPCPRFERSSPRISPDRIKNMDRIVMFLGKQNMQLPADSREMGSEFD
jgi:hypothetical protein